MSTVGAGHAPRLKVPQDDLALLGPRWVWGGGGTWGCQGVSVGIVVVLCCRPGSLLPSRWPCCSQEDMITSKARSEHQAYTCKQSATPVKGHAGGGALLQVLLDNLRELYALKGVCGDG